MLAFLPSSLLVVVLLPSRVLEVSEGVMEAISYLAVSVAQSVGISLVIGVMGLCPALGFTTMVRVLDFKSRVWN